jgi:putative intracellular protease/amidase
MRIQVAPPATPTFHALFLTADKFEDMELFVQYFRLIEAAAHVDIAAPTRGMIGGEHGYAIEPDLTIDAVDADRYDLLVIPGGFPDGAPATVRGIAKAQKIAAPSSRRASLSRRSATAPGSWCRQISFAVGV